MKFFLALLIAFSTVTAKGQNTSVLKNNFGGTSRLGAVAFAINNKGYLGTGYLYDGAEHYFNDFWEYDPTTDVWTQKADFGGVARQLAVGFSIGSKGYIGTGADIVFRKDFWEYDPVFNKWTQKADFGGSARGASFGFSVSGKGYIGAGTDGAAYRKDFWQYDPLSDSWSQQADCGGSARYSATAFGMDGKGYAGTGLEGFTYKNDFWEYDPASDTWEKKADFAGTPRYGAVAFSIIKGYIATGYGSSGYCNDIWEYDAQADSWTQQIDFGGSARVNAAAFSITGKAYIATGRGAAATENDCWDYTPGLSAGSPCQAPIFLYLTDITAATAVVHWTGADNAFSYRIRKRQVGTATWTYSAVTAPLNFKKLTNNLSNTMYEVQVQTYCNAAKTDSSGYSSSVYFTSGCNMPVINIVTASANPICKGSSTTLTIDGVLNDAEGWTWYAGSCGGTPAGSGTSIAVAPEVTTKYYAIGEGGCALAGSCYPVTVNVNPAPKAKIAALGNLDICTSGYVDLQAGSGTNFSYQWKFNGANIGGATTQVYHATEAGDYKVKVSNSAGCTNTSKATAVYTSCKMNSSDINKQSTSALVHPNPVQSTAIVSVFLSKASDVWVALYDGTGSKRQTLLEERVGAGTYNLPLQRNGQSKGFYFLKVVITDPAKSTKDEVIIRKVIFE